MDVKAKLESIDVYSKMIDMANGISLSQVCSIVDLQPHMIQNWVKRGYVPHPINKKYYVKHLSRILLINALKECMYIEDIGSLMVYINGDVDDESDDIISERDLYKLFTDLINCINNLNKIDYTVDLKVKDKKLNTCMKIMCNAYFASMLSKKSSNYLALIK